MPQDYHKSTRRKQQTKRRKHYRFNRASLWNNNVEDNVVSSETPVARLSETKSSRLSHAAHVHVVPFVFAVDVVSSDGADGAVFVGSLAVTVAPLPHARYTDQHDKNGTSDNADNGGQWEYARPVSQEGRVW